MPDLPTGLIFGLSVSVASGAGVGVRPDLGETQAAFERRRRRSMIILLLGLGSA